MASLLTTVQFWTSREELYVKDADVGCSTFHSKGEQATDQNYYDERRNYTEGRGYAWTLSNKRPEKLRDALKELEELSSVYRCINLCWKTQQVIQATFSNGTIAYIATNSVTGEPEKIFIDKFLAGKLHSEYAVDVIYEENGLIFSFVEPKLNYVQFTKKSGSADGSKKWEKLAALDPKVTTIDIVGPTGRRLERKLSCSLNNNLLMLWWRTSSNEVWPWTPLTTDRERANIHVYSMNGAKFELVCYYRTETEPLMATFSKLRPHQILTLEQKVSHTGEIFAEHCVYEVTLTKLQRSATAAIPLTTPIICQQQNPQEDRILIGCEDSSLIMFDDYRHVTQTTKSTFVPSVISWHPNGTIVLVASEKGQIQCYDQGLSIVKLQLLAEEPNLNRGLDLSTYFRYQPVLQKMLWNPLKVLDPSAVSCSAIDRAVMAFDRGPFGLLQFQLGVLSRGMLTPLELISQYVKCKQLDEAVNLLSSLNWNVDGQLCYQCLMIIMNYLLKLPLTVNREASRRLEGGLGTMTVILQISESLPSSLLTHRLGDVALGDVALAQLEAALGTFYAPSRPLTKVTILEYRDRVRNLARRFFHHMLRFQRLEKASLLAVDIGSRDLFKDIYYVAMDRGDQELAEAALRNAEEIEEGSYASGTDTGESQDYEDENDEYSDSPYSSDYSDSYSYGPEHTQKRHPPAKNAVSSVPPPPLPKKNVAKVVTTSVVEDTPETSTQAFQKMFPKWTTSAPTVTSQQRTEPVGSPVQLQPKIPASRSYPFLAAAQRHQAANQQPQTVPTEKPPYREPPQVRTPTQPDIHANNVPQPHTIKHDVQFHKAASVVSSPAHANRPVPSRNEPTAQSRPTEILSIRPTYPEGGPGTHKQIIPRHKSGTTQGTFHPPSYTSALDPNEQFVDGETLSAGDSEDEEASGTVKVVHFGIV